MNSFESQPQIVTERPVYVLLGGGSIGSAAAGVVAENPNALVIAGVGMSDEGSLTGWNRWAPLDPRGKDNRTPNGDVRRSSSALSESRQVAALTEKRFGATDTVEDVALRSEELLAAIALTNSRVTPQRANEIMDGTIDLSKKISEIRNGDLKGFSFGHFLFTHLDIEHGNIDDATQEAGDLMATRGLVIPTSVVSHRLGMYDGSELVMGEHRIDTEAPKHPDQVSLFLTPNAPINPRLKSALLSADKIGVGPGSWRTSIEPVLLTNDVPETMAEAQANGATLALNGNLVTVKTDTPGWKGEDFIKTAESRLPGNTTFDEIIVNRATSVLPKESAVVFELDRLKNKYHCVAGNLVDLTGIVVDPNDPKDNGAEYTHNMSAFGAAFVGNIEKLNTFDLSPELVKA